MSKYKVRPYRDGFKVWKLKNLGNGCIWDDVKRVFPSRELAEKFIEEEKRGEEK